MPHSIEIGSDSKKNERFQSDKLFRRQFFQQDAVRHLAWLVSAPPLLEDSMPDAVHLPWPEDVMARLDALDQAPEPLLQALAQRNNRRLGLYFECLYRFALESLLGCEVLAHGLAIRQQGQTLGELDFILRLGRQIHHHEIAVKFYLGWTPTAAGQRAAGWYGPDTRDQLARKLAHLRERQIPLAHQTATAETLRAQAIPQPQVSSIGLFGYLFENPNVPSPPLPAGVHPRYNRGHWYPLAEARALLTDSPQPGDWLPLFKPNWLGPLQLASLAPEEARKQRELALQRIAARQHPMLFARMGYSEDGEFRVEEERCFVTPDAWPGTTP
ncbi:DUF1853 family protein [Marinobacteraceae bacterium S3BR75-40.1]